MRLCSRKVVFVSTTVRNRLRVGAVSLSTVASASGGVQKACEIDLLSPQKYWHLQRKCLCQRSIFLQLYGHLEKRCLSDLFVSPRL